MKCTRYDLHLKSRHFCFFFGFDNTRLYAQNAAPGKNSNCTEVARQTVSGFICKHQRTILHNAYQGRKHFREKRTKIRPRFRRRPYAAAPVVCSNLMSVTKRLRVWHSVSSRRRKKKLGVRVYTPPWQIGNRKVLAGWLTNVNCLPGVFIFFFLTNCLRKQFYGCTTRRTLSS